MIYVFLLFLVGLNAVSALQYSLNMDLPRPQDDEDTQVKAADAIYPSNCAEAVQSNGPSGVYKIQIPGSQFKAFYVYCQVDPDGGPAWTVFQRRMDGSIDFFRNWQEYVGGFGNIDGEYFIGLDILHEMTDSDLNELWIQMEDFEGQTRFAKYATFAITDSTRNYTMNVLGQYSGDANDSLTFHVGQKFSTKDRDQNYCAQTYKGGWWYKACHASNLNGLYLKGEYPKDQYAQGVVWFYWHGHYYSLKYVHMAIRPKQFTLKGTID